MGERKLQKMKIIQINGWQGKLLPFLLPFMQKGNPDILCMQEVTFSNVKAAKLPILGLLDYGETVGKHFSDYYFSPLFSFQALGAKVDYGNAVFSKHRLEKKETVFVNNSYKSNETAKNFTKNIVNLQLVSLKIDSKILSVSNHHGFHELDPLGSNHSTEVMNKAIRHLKHTRSPIIVCGDFNINPQSPAMKEVRVLGLRNLTVESGTKSTLSKIHYAKKQVVCDYIFVSEDVKVKNFKVSEEIVSDHKALILEFGI